MPSAIGPWPLLNLVAVCRRARVAQGPAHDLSSPFPFPRHCHARRTLASHSVLFCRVGGGPTCAVPLQERARNSWLWLCSCGLCAGAPDTSRTCDLRFRKVRSAPGIASRIRAESRGFISYVDAARKRLDSSFPRHCHQGAQFATSHCCLHFQAD